MIARTKTSPETALAPLPQRDVILRAAAQLFRKKGYDGTTVRELADAVGLQSGSLFHHFKTKDDILFAVMEHGLDLASASVEAAESMSRTPHERIENVLRAYLTALLDEDHRDFMTVLLYDFRSLSPQHEERVRQYRRQIGLRLEEDLAQAFPAEHPKLDIHLKAQFIFGAMNWAVQWHKPDGQLDLAEMTQKLTQLSLAAAGL